MRRSVLTAIVFTAACTHGPAIVGDAYWPGSNNASDLVAFAVDSGLLPARITLAPWTAKSALLVRRESEQAATFSATKDLVAVVGHTGSRGARFAAEVYNREHVPHIVPTATSRRLAESGPWTFRLAPDDDAEGQFIADYALDTLQARRVAVFYIGDEYGVGIREGVASRLGARGYRLADQTSVAAWSCSATPSQLEQARIVIRASLARSTPDAVVLAIGSSAARCWITEILAERPDVWIITADGVDLLTPNLQHMTAAQKDRVRGVAFWTAGTDSLNQAFVARARRVLGREPNAGDALSFDAFALISAAVREVGPNRRAIRAWLESLGTTRQAWVGVTGRVCFSEGRGHVLRMLRVP